MTDSINDINILLMVNERGLTELNESGRGFVGLYVKKNPTKNGRRRLRFQIAIGNTNIEKLEFATWITCVAYDNVASSIWDLKPRSYIRFAGYVLTEVCRDDNGRPLFDDNKKPVTKRTSIITEAEILNRQVVQPRLISTANV